MDQVDQLSIVGHGATTAESFAGIRICGQSSTGHRGCQARRNACQIRHCSDLGHDRRLWIDAGHSTRSQCGLLRTNSCGCEARLSLECSLQRTSHAGIVVADKVWNRDYQILYVVRFCLQLTLGETSTLNRQRFVLDSVRQIQLLKNLIQCALQANRIPLKVERDRRIDRHTFLFNRSLVDIDRDAEHFADGTHCFRKRSFVE